VVVAICADIHQYAAAVRIEKQVYSRANHIQPKTSVKVLGRVCKSVYGQRGYVQVELVMRLRPKVKRLLPKIAEAIISIEIDSLEKR
jgi:hypothetical protein